MCRHKNDYREGRCVYIHESLETSVITHYVESHGAGPLWRGEGGRSQHGHKPPRGIFGEEWTRISRLPLESLDASRLWALGHSPVIWYWALGDLGQREYWPGGRELEKGDGWECGLRVLWST